MWPDWPKATGCQNAQRGRIVRLKMTAASLALQMEHRWPMAAVPQLSAAPLADFAGVLVPCLLMASTE